MDGGFLLAVERGRTGCCQYHVSSLFSCVIWPGGAEAAADIRVGIGTKVNCGESQYDDEAERWTFQPCIQSDQRDEKKWYVYEGKFKVAECHQLTKGTAASALMAPTSKQAIPDPSMRMAPPDAATSSKK